MELRNAVLMDAAEIAWRRRSDSIDRAVRIGESRTTKHEEYLAGWDTGFDAGVAEGIRQAREAVNGLHRFGTARGDDYTMDALEAIDALGATT